MNHGAGEESVGGESMCKGSLLAARKLNVIYMFHK